MLWCRLGAALALITLVAIALLTPERLPHEATTLKIDGAAVVAPVEVDLSKTFTVTGTGTPQQLGLDLSAAGIPLGSATAIPKADGNGFRAEATFPGITRWIVGGAVTATVTADGTSQTFTLVTQQHPLASALGAGSLILALFALAYLESGLRTIRNGHRWRGALVAGPCSACCSEPRCGCASRSCGFTSRLWCPASDARSRVRWPRGSSSRRRGTGTRRPGRPAAKASMPTLRVVKEPFTTPPTRPGR